MPDQIDTRSSWLSDEAIEAVRGQVPLVYVEALPVRVDERGTVTHAGLLLRVRRADHLRRDHPRRNRVRRLGGRPLPG